MRPPMEGPPSWVVAWVPEVRLFRDCSSSLSTMEGRKVELATSKMTFAKLITRATITNWATVRPSHHQASGIETSAAARARSAPICALRIGNRCTITPAGRPITIQAT